MFNVSVLGLLLLLAALAAWAAQAITRARPVQIIYVHPLTGKRVTHMQVTPDTPLALLVKGLDKIGNIVDLPVGTTVQSTSADPTIATATQSGDGKAVSVTEVKVGNTVLSGTASLADGSTLSGSVSLECVGGAATSLTYVPAFAGRR